MAGGGNVRSPEGRLAWLGPRAGSSGWGWSYPTALLPSQLQARVTVWGRLFGLVISRLGGCKVGRIQFEIDELPMRPKTLDEQAAVSALHTPCRGGRQVQVQAGDAKPGLGHGPGQPRMLEITCLMIRLRRSHGT